MTIGSLPLFKFDHARPFESLLLGPARKIIVSQFITALILIRIPTSQKLISDGLIPRHKLTIITVSEELGPG